MTAMIAFVEDLNIGCLFVKKNTENIKIAIYASSRENKELKDI